MGDTYDSGTGSQSYYFLRANADTTRLHTRHATAANILHLDFHVEAKREWAPQSWWRLISDDGAGSNPGFRYVGYYNDKFVAVNN
jgi:prepilin-type processing-associated H-X9-DG protein